MRKDRLEVIDYLDVPVEQSTDRFYISKKTGDVPSFTVNMFNSLLKPLDRNVWWVLLATLFVLSLALKGTASLSGGENRQTLKGMTWATCLLNTVMATAGQGWTSTPSSLSGRILTIFMWFLCIIISNSYTATLTSHLTVAVVDRPISSLKEFSESSDWSLMVSPDHIHLNDWKRSKDGYERALYQRFINKDRFIPFYRTKESAMECARPKIMTYVNIDRLFSLIGPEACHLVSLYKQPKEATQFNYMVMTKGKENLRRSINHVMRKVSEAGIIETLKRRWIKRPETCASPLGVRPVSFANSFALLMIVPLGIASSVVIFGLELVLVRRVKRKILKSCSHLFHKI
ncbi:Glutamate receptor 3 [Amphibalanus amphitrite]|uniref:Glutamate receptor 3 n=1 Tax=Amphibalanus amphitrite TaxID=1232801 RepID=A0A6A4VQU4_AMPAM|nr:Glutamate receptor 3 [Amphibalanus amphitrite]